MKRNSSHALVLLVSFLLVACGGKDKKDGEDTGTDADAPVDTGTDLVPDAEPDTPTDGEPDTPVDTVTDTPTDTIADGDAPTDGSADCAPPLLDCDGVCTDVSNDVANCGGCGIACATGETCVSGVCDGTGSCPSGYVECAGGECRDLSGDPENCGRCRVRCGHLEHCSMGACVCRPGLTDCGGECVDITADVDHCGACDATCGDVCVSGTCTTGDTCTETVCDSACVDTDTDTRHCGECGNRCARDQVCFGADCWDYEPAIDCTSCSGCTCPTPEICCDLTGYGISCVDTTLSCP